MELPALSQRARRRLLVAALLGVGSYAAYRAWRDETRLTKAVRSTVAELQRAGEAALTRATACVVAGTVQGVAAVRPQAVEAPAPQEPWQAMALEKLMGLLTSRAGMDLVSLAVAVGAQHSVAAVCAHWSAQRAAAAATAHARQQQQRPGRNGAQQRPGQQGGQQNEPQNGWQNNGQQNHGLQQGGRQSINGRRQPTNGQSGGHAVAAQPLEEPLGNAIVAQLLAWAATPQGERFVVSAMAAAARHSTSAYMDSLGAGNTYDDLFAAAFRPAHREVLRDLTVMATREAVATYLCPPLQHRTDGTPAAPGNQLQRSSASWSTALHSIGSGTAFLVKHVSNNSRAAAVALPVVLLASSRGVALGCKDAIARLRADPADYLPARIYVFDGARSVLWLLLAVVAAMAMAAFGARQVFWREVVPALHTA